MSKRTWRWVARDPGEPDVWIWHGKNSEIKPTLDKDGAWDINEVPTSCCSVGFTEFKAATGITVPSSHPIKVDFGGVKVVE